ncbi:hypothetical protein V6N11_020101 [Hibiscus sabdariffa]|uniref:Uncharacterized protein n=1 Tax=Hibiscus sabdariffa TaxID=183260 RepID=A0ABR2P8M5_9ROSI
MVGKGFHTEEEESVEWTTLQHLDLGREEFGFYGGGSRTCNQRNNTWTRQMPIAVLSSSSNPCTISNYTQVPFRLVAEEGKSKCSWVSLDDVSNNLVRAASLHTIPDLCWELAQLQDTYILQGDYDLKVMRQEFYISRQKERDKGYTSENHILLQDIGTSDSGAPGEKWFVYDVEQKPDVEKYISSIRTKRLKNLYGSKKEGIRSSMSKFSMFLG